MVSRFLRSTFAAAWIWLALPALHGAPQKDREYPVAMVLEAKGGQLRRAQKKNSLQAKPGDLVFAGDAIELEHGSVSVAVCGDHAVYDFPPDPTNKSVVAAGAQQLTGPLMSVPKLLPGVCRLPMVKRENDAGEERYGDSLNSPAAQPSQVTPVDPADLSPLDAADLQRIDATPADPRSPGYLVAMVSRFAILQSYGSEEKAAIGTLALIRKNWAGAAWTEPLLFDLLRHGCTTIPATLPTGDGKTYALVIGESTFDKIGRLQYTGSDATSFGDYVKTERGGKASVEDHTLFLDLDVPSSTIRNHIEAIVKAAGLNDTVYIFIASHGDVDNVFGKGYILARESDPQNYRETALSMQDVNQVMNNQLCRVGKVRVFLDVCHAGLVDQGPAPRVTEALKRQMLGSAKVAAFMASRSTEYSLESDQFGGGHGAFSYFVLKALAGDADGFGIGAKKDGAVTIQELIDYLASYVPQATGGSQHPETGGEVFGQEPIADLAKTGLDFRADWKPLQGAALEMAMRGGRGVQPPSTPPTQPVLNPWEERFGRAIAAKLILPHQTGSAFDMLSQVSRQDPKYPEYQNRLRVALEEAGQKVIGTYLEGNEVPQQPADFQNCAAYYEAAYDLTPESVYLHARQLFCDGRATLFDKQKWREALDKLEYAARLDTVEAYISNAIGIAYLEQGEFARAAPAFLDAIANAPQWAYPRHNLALAYAEQGNFVAAIDSYKEAIERAPNYFYLPYNLGLVYERINRPDEAERYYRIAMVRDPNLPEPYNAIGSLKQKAHRDGQAEHWYNEALDRDRNFAPALHNLGLLLARKRGRLDDAIKLWHTNVESNKYLPSQVALADTLFPRKDRRDDAIREFRKLLELSPDYVGARIKLAQLLPDPRLASVELQEALKKSPANPLIEERLADLESRYNVTAALAMYQSSREHSNDPRVRNRVGKKLRKLQRKEGRAP